jgi:hypothetical protein
MGERDTENKKKLLHPNSVCPSVAQHNWSGRECRE